MRSSEERKKRIQELEEEKQIHMAEMELMNLKSNASRARAVTVGTAFGGVTEVSLRGDGGVNLWCLLQPVEVTELIHQLAGNIGCHINIQPRKDFASWRQWKEPENDLLAFHPPHPNDIAEQLHIGAVLPSPEKQAGLNYKNKAKSQNESVAIEKTINKRKSKRTPATT